MPWKETDVMDQRKEFVLRAKGGGSGMRDLCAEYGISTKTGYKWLRRAEEGGLKDLADRSRRPHKSPRQLGEPVICRIVKLKNAHPKWGPRKIHQLYVRRFAETDAPSESTVKRVLKNCGLVQPRHRRRAVRSQRIVHRVQPQSPNDLWTVDFKGWWWTSTHQRCEPLTVRDEYSRYVLAVQALSPSSTEGVQQVFEALFATHGLPGIIRSDNGSPFACTRALLGLSRLSAWWLALGIELDRITPGRPCENGGHERMHRDLRCEIQGLIEGDLDDHQASFDVWRRQFNEERPHEALEMKTPSEVYRNSRRLYEGTPRSLDYPEAFLSRTVSAKGTIRLHGQVVFLSTALAGWNVGLQWVDSGYRLWFNQIPLGKLDINSGEFAPLPTPGPGPGWAELRPQP